MTDRNAADASDATPKRRLLAHLGLLGPAFVAAVAFVDPGNVATNLQAGTRYGYLLTWVLVVATASAGLIQYLSAKLGIVTGQSLSELLCSRLNTPIRLSYWLQAEVIAIATDLAEVVGGAIALQLLFNLPLFIGGVISGGVSILLLLIRDGRGQRRFEQVITGLLLIIAIGFVAGLFAAPPSPSGVLQGLVPRFDGLDSLVLASGMFGATVMPHVVYLHSAMTRDRFGRVAPGAATRRVLSATKLDVLLAMTVAGGVNIAMLLLAASALRGHANVDTITGAHAAVTDALGPGIGLLFAIGLLVSGLASGSVGAYAGSEIMAGLLHRRFSLTFRRLVTLVPALVVLAMGAKPTAALVISQVVLSFGIPFALFPLVWLTSQRSLMGDAVNRTRTASAGWLVATGATVLNLALIVQLVLTA